MKPEVSYGGNRRKGKAIALLPFLGDISRLISLKLCLKDCLSVHAKCYDPLGLVLPVKMVGNLLFRETLQKMKLESGKNVLPWDNVVPDVLLEKWLEYFKILVALKEVAIVRSIKPENVNDDILPILVTFADGNEAAFGCNAYALWTLRDSSVKVTLIMSKAKLSPLMYKGEVSKSELSASVLAARLKIFIQQESKLQFGEHVPFLDSQIAQFMMHRDSYIYITHSPGSEYQNFKEKQMFTAGDIFQVS